MTADAAQVGDIMVAADGITTGADTGMDVTGNTAKMTHSI